MRTNRRTQLAIVFSIMLHMIVGALLWFKPNLFSNFAGLRKPKMQMEFVDADQLIADLKKLPSQAPLGQIVDQSEEALNNEVPVDPKFLSRHNQTVVRQSQAALHGKFRNSDQSAGDAKREMKAGKLARTEQTSQKLSTTEPPAAEQDPAHAKEQAKVERLDLKSKNASDVPPDLNADKFAETKTAPELSEKLHDENGGTVVRLGGRPKFKDLVPSFIPAPPIEAENSQVAQGGGSGASTTDDRLKDIDIGSQTVLSTREFVYFSYYNRIKDKLRQFWEPKIKEKISHILRQGRHIASSTDHTTRIVIVLDRKGSLQHVQVMSGSGVEDLDDAAVEAFRAAAPFPNPPKGIIDPDGTVKINWDFVIEA